MSEKLNEEQKALVKQLSSNDSVVLTDSINKIREMGSVKMFPAVFDLYQRNVSGDVQKAIIKLVMDVKDKAVAAHIAEALSSREWDAGLSDMLSAIWQSGLDYGAHLPVFVPFAKSEDMNVAMEALTCIEEFFYNESVENREAIRGDLKQIALDSSGHHRDLVMIYLNNLK
ncbi:MAG: hypothetical protein PF448_03760 [Bacteroidales bacterium]|jgi:hypothetical protein|nr:hypothetical protein [Bacteroidales bacterium]